LSILLFLFLSLVFTFIYLICGAIFAAFIKKYSSWEHLTYRKGYIPTIIFWFPLAIAYLFHLIVWRVPYSLFKHLSK